VGVRHGGGHGGPPLQLLQLGHNTHGELPHARHDALDEAAQKALPC
jgi:hypothetical protein